MSYRDIITDAELDIMKVLWKIGASTSPVIFATMQQGHQRNTGTLKTLLIRLVRKGAVRREEINSRHFLYIPVISEDEYIKNTRRKLIDRVFGGSAKNMMFNLVREEDITKGDLEEMIRQIDKGE